MKSMVRPRFLACVPVALLAVAPASSQPVQEPTHLADAGAACRDADDVAIRMMRPMVITDGEIDTRALKIVVTSLDMARGYCALGWTAEGLDIYRRLNDGLAQRARDGAWPLE